MLYINVGLRVHNIHFNADTVKARFLDLTIGKHNCVCLGYDAFLLV